MQLLFLWAKTHKIVTKLWWQTFFPTYDSLLFCQNPLCDTNDKKWHLQLFCFIWGEVVLLFTFSQKTSAGVFKRCILNTTWKEASSCLWNRAPWRFAYFLQAVKTIDQKCAQTRWDDKSLYCEIRVKTNFTFRSECRLVFQRRLLYKVSLNPSLIHGSVNLPVISWRVRTVQLRAAPSFYLTPIRKLKSSLEISQ